ncbi:MAG: trimethylamine methyltransferase family protein [Desulfitobacteriaceae bacterium]
MMKPLVEMLSEQEVQEIHRASLEVLENVGVEFHGARALELFKSKGARVQGNTVYLSPRLVEERLALAPARFLLEARDSARSVWIGENTVCAPPAGVVYIQDAKEGRRPANQGDYLNLVRIIHQSSIFGTNGGGLVIPEAPSFSEVEKYAWMVFAGHWYSDKPQMGFALGEENSRVVLDMADIVFEGRPGCHTIATVNPDSPLVFSEKMVEGLFAFAEAGQPAIVAPCSMAMATSPVTLAGTLVVNNAEVLAGIVLAQLINSGTPVVYGNTSAISDMQTMAIALGAPELSLLVAATAQLARFYKVPSRTGGALTDAKTPDIQAGTESMLSMFTSLVSQASIVMHAGGILDSFLTLSYEKLIIDEDVNGMASRFLRGIKIDEESLALEVIKEKGSGSHFLDTEHTMKHFKQEFWRPQLSDRQVFQAGRDYSSYVVEKATAAWQQRIATFERPALKPEVEKGLLKYYRDRFGREPY